MCIVHACTREEVIHVCVHNLVIIHSPVCSCICSVHCQTKWQRWHWSVNRGENGGRPHWLPLLSLPPSILGTNLCVQCVHLVILIIMTWVVNTSYLWCHALVIGYSLSLNVHVYMHVNSNSILYLLYMYMWVAIASILQYHERYL